MKRVKSTFQVYYGPKTQKNLDFGSSMQVENFLDPIQSFLKTTGTNFAVLSLEWVILDRLRDYKKMMDLIFIFSSYFYSSWMIILQRVIINVLFSTFFKQRNERKLEEGCVIKIFLGWEGKKDISLKFYLMRES